MYAQKSVAGLWRMNNGSWRFYSFWQMGKGAKLHRGRFSFRFPGLWAERGGMVIFGGLTQPQLG